MTAALDRLTLAVYTALIAYISLAPSTGVGSILWDKSMHVTVYAVYALIGSASVSRRKAFIQLLLVLLAYGALLELAQGFIAGRYMSAADFVANGIGLLLGGALSLLVQPQLRR